MTKTVPDDGQPHILAQRGRFVITQTTLFCGVPARIDRFFEEKGIGVGLNGEPFVMLSFS